jgi:methionyl-tRNA formyltransferase
MAGDRRSGVAVMRTVSELDAGPLVAMAEFAVSPDDDAAELERRALELGIPLLITALRAAADGHLEEEPQTLEAVTYAEKITRADRLLDPTTMSARSAHDRVRALRPRHGALLALDDEPITIWRTEVVDMDGEPGEVVVDHDALIVGFVAGSLRVTLLQSAGRRELPVADWLRGRREVPMRASRVG